MSVLIITFKHFYQDFYVDGFQSFVLNDDEILQAFTENGDETLLVFIQSDDEILKVFVQCGGEIISIRIDDGESMNVYSLGSISNVQYD